MATLGVRGTYPNIQAAVGAASGGDTIPIVSGYAGNEAISVTVDNLTFTAPADVLGVVLTAAPGISRIDLTDASPIRVIGNASNNHLSGNSGANHITDEGGRDDILNDGSGNSTVAGRAGNDTLFGGTGDDALFSRGGTTAFGRFGSASTARVSHA
jgi:Ca2+-binding RTX toxin-like protein